MPTVPPPPVTGSSRKRVVDALAHVEPDRMPVDFGGTTVSGIQVSVVAALRDRLGLERRSVKLIEPYQMLGEVDDELKRALGLDVEGVFRRKTKFGFELKDWKTWSLNGLEVLVPGMFNTTTDTNGDILLYPEGDLAVPPSGRMPKGFCFFDNIIRQNHFDEDHLNVEDNLEEFKPISDADIAVLRADAEAARATGRAVIALFGGTPLGDISNVPAPGLKDPRGIRDFTEWYVSIRTRRDYIHAIFDRQVDITLANFERIAPRIGDLIDMVYICGTDFGTQTSAFCSVPTFRELWLPYYKRMNDWVHAHTNWKTFKHSCGSVERFYESFIEAGFDIVNPVQCSAAGMDPELLKSKYGMRLTFWGGGVDQQKTLSFGTPAEVREQVLRRCEIFAPGGGFVFNAVHNVQAGTSVDNIMAMFAAVREFQGR